MPPLYKKGNMRINLKKIFLSFPLCFLALLGLFSCRTVETASLPRTVSLKLEVSSNEPFAVFVYKGAGLFEEVSPLKPFFYQIKVPMMDGGYKQFLFIKYSIHNPNEYKIFQIKKQGNLLSELSLKDIDLLEKDPEGFSRLILK